MPYRWNLRRAEAAVPYSWDMAGNAKVAVPYRWNLRSASRCAL